MNPVELVRKPKISSGRDRRLTSGEERRLSRYFRDKNQQLYVIFHLAPETAMRQGGNPHITLGTPRFAARSGASS